MERDGWRGFRLQARNRPAIEFQKHDFCRKHRKSGLECIIEYDVGSSPLVCFASVYPRLMEVC
jgi:hypothetical protein